MPDYGINKNCEGYSDPTAATAIRNVMAGEDAEQRQRLSVLIRILKDEIDAAGFDLLERIALRDRKTGREYR